MIHPDTELRHIDGIVGYGVFATKKIPEGTIVYVKDSLELIISPEDYWEHPQQMQKAIDKYSYIDETGCRIISWDFAKYVNHSCNYNTISTGYGFEIAIKDIEPGEEITDEYGIFNLEQEMSCSCQYLSCRQRIKPNDFDHYYQEWDQKIRKSLLKLLEVKQPLFSFIDSATKLELDKFCQNPHHYKSVYNLKYQPPVSLSIAL